MTIMVLQLVLAPLVALPVVAGPILLIVHLSHGPIFTAHSASSSLLGLVSWQPSRWQPPSRSRLPRR